jgi:SNF2 family DNA or RNA helicase
VIDELALMRNQSTDRWKALNAICNKQVKRKVWGLTGSPIPNSPADAYAQVKLVTPFNKKLPKYFGAFRNQVMTQINQFKWVPKADAVDTVHELMQPAVRFSLDECVDLPPQVFLTKKAELSDTQKKAYASMLSSLKAEFEDGQITAVNEAIKASKLSQIALGVAYDEAGTPVVLPSAPRLEVLLETIEQSEGKVIVFIPYTGALRHVEEFLKSKGITTEVVDGSVSKTDRDRIFGLFQRTNDPRVLVANPSAMSHGLTLTAATTIVWYGAVHSNEIYQQACARVRRPGQKKTTVIVHIVSTRYEETIYERLKNKQGVQGALLDMMEEATNNTDN